jgi:phospholipid transport system substrate-binding protein
MRAILVSLVFAVLALGPARATDARAVPGPGPQQLIEKVSQDLLRAIDADRAALARDPAKLRALVDRILLPSFDATYSAQLVLGKHWRTATDQQRQRFVDAFVQSMMRKYGNALLEFTAQRLTILPFKGDPAADRATVRTEVKRDNGTPVPVNYSLHATPQGWKAWDVTIEGISYVKNFRTDFGAEIEAKGLDAVIRRLEAEGAASATPAPKAAGKAG